MSEQTRSLLRSAEATHDLFAKIRSLERAVTPQSIAATLALFAPMHTRAPAGVSIARDLQYGSAERQRLDVFTPEEGPEQSRDPRPVLLFVHGGGFVGGDKSSPAGPFYENVGSWAVRNGMTGVTMTYRLAPEHRWPAGSEDVALAVRWLRANIAAHGGDPERIVLMGQSAGAVHVAGYVAREHSGNEAQWQPAAAVLVSGLYDTRTMERTPLFDAYFGEVAESSECSFLAALARTPVPLMVVTAELDPRDFLSQSIELLQAWLQERGRLPRFVQLAGHNHLSPVLGLNAPGDRLGAQMIEFFALQRIW